MEIRVEPEELIVGNRTAGVRYGVVFPESGSTWVDKEFETLPTRPQDRFNVHQEDIETFRKDHQTILGRKILRRCPESEIWKRDQRDRQSCKDQPERPRTRTYLSRLCANG